MYKFDDISKQIKVLKKQKYKFTDVSTNDTYPKTLVIRNTKEGMVWQIYNVEKRIEAILLSKTAFSNGFLGITLEDFNPEATESFPDWRETDGGKKIINSTEDDTN